MPIIKSACILFLLHYISECANTEQILSELVLLKKVLKEQELSPGPFGLELALQTTGTTIFLIAGTNQAPEM